MWKLKNSRKSLEYPQQKGETPAYANSNIKNKFKIIQFSLSLADATFNKCDTNDYLTRKPWMQVIHTNYCIINYCINDLKILHHQEFNEYEC